MAKEAVKGILAEAISSQSPLLAELNALCDSLYPAVKPQGLRFFPINTVFPNVAFEFAAP